MRKRELLAPTVAACTNDTCCEHQQEGQICCITCLAHSADWKPSRIGKAGVAVYRLVASMQHHSRQKVGRGADRGYVGEGGAASVQAEGSSPKAGSGHLGAGRGSMQGEVAVLEAQKAHTSAKRSCFAQYRVD